jgi:hypothetical protein
MYEVRHRLDFILRLRDGEFTLPPSPAYELCYLQLRMICETMALACLVVHGEIPGTRAAPIRSAHEADVILKKLGDLHASFYPQPGIPAPHPPTGGRIFVPSSAAYMTKSELIDLYHRCGDRLHRGDYEDAKTVPEIDFEPITVATLKIIELLKFHKISFFGIDDEMWVIMGDPKTGKVTATLERPIRD